MSEAMPSLHKLLEMVKDDVREMDWEKLAPDQHTVMVAKADVIEIINDWIAYCLEEWPQIHAAALKRKRTGKKRRNDGNHP